MKLINPRLAQLAILVFIAFVYLKTMPPSILWVDSGTMVAAAYDLGIPNPPGFPTYMMAAHTFLSVFPWGSVLFKMQLFTVIFSLATLAVVYEIILLLVRDSLHSSHLHLSALFGMVALAFSYQFWSQSHNTDAFIFTYFFLSVFVYLCLRILIFKRNLFKYLAIIAVLYGLAAGANPTISLFVPSVLLVMYVLRRNLSMGKLVILGSLFLVVFAAVYSYLPIRSRANPFVDWGNPENLPAILGHMVGSGLNLYAPEASIVNGFTGSPFVFAQSLANFIWHAGVTFTPFLLPFLAIGIWQVWRANRILAVFFLLPISLTVLYTCLYFSGNQESWYIPVFIFFSIFIGVGFSVLASRITQIGPIRLMSLICLAPLLFWWTTLDRSWHTTISDYGKNLYGPLKKDALLLGTGDLFGSQSYYLHEVDGSRSDVLPIIYNQFYFSSWMRDNLRGKLKISEKVEDLMREQNPDKYNEAWNNFIADNIEKHPIYILPFFIESSTFPGDPRGTFAPDERFKLMPHGLTFEVVKKESSQTPDFSSFEYKFETPGFPDKRGEYLERTYNRIQGDVLYQYGRGMLGAGDWWTFDKENPAFGYFWYKKALAFQPFNSELMLRLGYYYDTTTQYDQARQFYEKAVSLNNNNSRAHYYLGVSYLNLGRLEDARREIYTLDQLAPESDIAQSLRQMIKNIDPSFEKEQ